MNYNDETIFVKCLQSLRLQQSYGLKYLNYYKGEHDILKHYRMNESASNMKLVFNFPKKFVRAITGYSLGVPVNYVSKSGNDDIVNAIDTAFTHWEKKHNQSLSIQSEIFGEAYEINYVNSNGYFKSTVANPLNMFVLDDETDDRNVKVAIHTFRKQSDFNVLIEYADIYVDNLIKHYTIKGEILEFISEDTHIFDGVPVNICAANEESECSFKDIISLIDAYNVNTSDLTNEISDHRNAYLDMQGVETPTDEELEKMKSRGVIISPVGSKIAWLIKEINDKFVQNNIQNLEKKIYDLMDMVNFNEQWASNTSNVALKNKLLALSHRCSLKESFFEATLSKRLINLFRYLKVKENLNYSHDDLSIKFTRDLPFDITSIADAVSKLSDVLSQETLITLFPFVDNVALEMKKYAGERNLDRLNLDLNNNSGPHA